MATTVFAHQVSNVAPDGPHTVVDVQFVDDSGNPTTPSGGGASVANATTSTAGIVKQAAHVADPAGDTPTKAEYIALRDALVTAGIMAGA